jgi:tetratricopeptide (TPR) repeat protein
MARPRDTRLSNDVAREVCLRTTSKAMLTGSISRLGSRYVMGITLINCQSGDSFGSEQVESDSREGLLSAVNRASTKLRAGLGESLASIQKYDSPVEQATTASLEALRSYSVGMKTRLAEGDQAAISLFARATELDPNFAMAYARLGSGHYNIGEFELAKPALRKSYELHTGVSERERLYIDSHFYMMVTGELDKAIPILELWRQEYPRDPAPHTSLGFAYTALGQPEKAVREYEEALRLDPASGTTYLSLNGAYQMLNQMDMAQEFLVQAQARKISELLLIVPLYYMAFLRHDDEMMKNQVTKGAGQPDIENLLFAFQANTEAYYGHLRDARRFSQRAVESALHAGNRENARGFRTEEALRENEFGNLQQARQYLSLARATNPDQPSWPFLAVILARTGATNLALAIARDLKRQAPLDTVMNNYWLPTIHAAVELHRGRPARAVELLQTVIPYELAIHPAWTTTDMFPVYLRGVAYLAARQGAPAAIEFQKIIDCPGVVGNFFIGSLARLGLARAYAMEAGVSETPLTGVKQIRSAEFAARRSEELAKARSAYQDFFALWKGADAEIPVIKQAQAEYRRLKSFP